MPFWTRIRCGTFSIHHHLLPIFFVCVNVRICSRCTTQGWRSEGGTSQDSSRSLQTGQKLSWLTTRRACEVPLFCSTLVFHSCSTLVYKQWQRGCEQLLPLHPVVPASLWFYHRLLALLALCLTMHPTIRVIRHFYALCPTMHPSDSIIVCKHGLDCERMVHFCLHQCWRLLGSHSPLRLPDSVEY